MNHQASFSFRNSARIMWSLRSLSFVRCRAQAKKGYWCAFLFCGCLLLPVLSSAQQKVPSLTPATITYLKENAAIVFPIDKQTLPFRDKVMLRFPELGTIYNPTFPETRNRVSVTNFRKAGANFIYIGKSTSTFRSTVFIRNTGTFYGVWHDGKCTSLIKYEVTRVGEQLEVTGKVYSCLVTA